MIEVLIYHAHLVAMVYAFSARWQAEGTKSGMLAVALIALAFTVLWALMGPIARLFMPAEPQAGALFTSDTLSLVLTTAAEIPLYRAFFLSRFGQNSKPS